MNHVMHCSCSFCRTFVVSTANPFDLYDKDFISRFNFVNVLLSLELVSYMEASALIYGRVYK